MEWTSTPKFDTVLFVQMPAIPQKVRRPPSVIQWLSWSQTICFAPLFVLSTGIVM